MSTITKFDPDQLDKIVQDLMHEHDAAVAAVTPLERSDRVIITLNPGEADVMSLLVDDSGEVVKRATWGYLTEFVHVVYGEELPEFEPGTEPAEPAEDE